MEIYQITNKLGQKVWKTFGKHHYLSGNLSKQCDCFIGIYENKLVSFCGIKQLAFQKGKKTISRLVVLPEFQSLGIGTQFLNEITKLYISKNWQVHIVTSNNGLIYSLNRDKHWKLFDQKLNRPVNLTFIKNAWKPLSYKGGTDLSNCFTRQITSFKTNKKIWYGDE